MTVTVVEENVVEENVYEWKRQRNSFVRTYASLEVVVYREGRYWTWKIQRDGFVILEHGVYYTKPSEAKHAASACLERNLRRLFPTMPRRKHPIK